jgi:anti-sigma regulatory factor (Ser/Thr protein kinase)
MHGRTTSSRRCSNRTPSRADLVERGRQPSRAASAKQQELPVHGLATGAGGYRPEATCDKERLGIVGVSAVREPTHRHVVGVYEHERDLASSAAGFASGALAESGTAIVIATPAHRAAIAAALTADGYAIDACTQAGSYVALDAAETLARFSNGRGLDAESFRDAIQPLLEAAGRRPGPIRAFGEIVTLLWDRGRVGDVLQLESLWNDIAERNPFELLCGYAMSSIESRADLAATKRMCDQHSEIAMLSAHTIASADAPRTFLATPTALRDVRSFVRDRLRGRCDDTTCEDAEIIVSELASNAVRHAQSPFRVSVACNGGTVRISVRDASFAPPLRLDSRGALVGGRGVALVAALARDWGTDCEPDGKTVWAEIASSGVRA